MDGLPPLGIEKLQAPLRRAGARPRPEARRHGRPHLRGVAQALRARGAARVEGDSGVRGPRNRQAALLLRPVRHRGGPGRGALEGGRLPRGDSRRALRRGGDGARRMGRDAPRRLLRPGRRVPRIGPRPARRDRRRIRGGRRPRARALGRVRRGPPLRRRPRRVGAGRGVPAYRPPGVARRDRGPRLRRERTVVAAAAGGRARRGGERARGGQAQTCGTGGRRRE